LPMASVTVNAGICCTALYAGLAAGGGAIAVSGVALLLPGVQAVNKKGRIKAVKKAVFLYGMDFRLYV
jgi:hypothetical protein